jgi:hypothetical protein
MQVGNIGVTGIENLSAYSALGVRLSLTLELPNSGRYLSMKIS